MGLFFADPPPPPNPYQTASAQTASNIGTAITGSYLNNVNQVTPSGSLTYSAGNPYTYNDPLGGSYSVPTWTATQAPPSMFDATGARAYLDYYPDLAAAQRTSGLSPLDYANQHYLNNGQYEGRVATASPERSVYNADIATKSNLATLGEQSSQRLSSLLNTNFNPYDDAQSPGMGDMNRLYGAPTAQTGFGDVGGLQRSLGPYASQQTGLANTGGQQYGFGDAGSQQYGFGDAGALARGYGPQDNFSADRQRVESALYQRMDPQLQADRERLRTQLADQGIRYGSKAYSDAMAQADRQTTDARLAVTQAGGQEQQRMMDMAAQEAGFQNAAQQQAYTQAMGRGTFANTAQQAQYQQALGRGQFANTAQAEAYKQALASGQFTNQAQLEQFQKDQQAAQFANEAQKGAFTQEASRAQFQNAATAQNFAQQKATYDAQNAQRGQYAQEQYALRAQPLNEITALQSGSQVSQPNFVNTNQQQIANTDIAGIINNRFSQELDIYKQQNANVNNVIGGLFGLAGSGAKAGATAYASDRRVKKNIHRVGTVFAAKRHDAPKKLPVYAYEYKDDPASLRHVGPMAQDVERIDPEAVTTRRGVKHIYPKKVMGDILRVS